MRAKVRANLASALRATPDAASEEDAARLSTAIEESLRTQSARADYIAKARSLVFNLRANAALRRSVARGGVQPEQLCAMDTRVECLRFLYFFIFVFIMNAKKNQKKQNK